MYLFNNLESRVLHLVLGETRHWELSGKLLNLLLKSGKLLVSMHALLEVNKFLAMAGLKVLEENKKIKNMG